MAAIKLDRKELGSVRFARLQERMGWGRAQTLGTLALFWADTRAVGQTHGDQNMLRHFITAPGDEAAFLEALVVAGYVSEHTEPHHPEVERLVGPPRLRRLVIVDNQGADAKLVARLAHARLAGAASVAKRKKKVRKKTAAPEQALAVAAVPSQVTVADDGSAFRLGCQATWQAYASAYQRQTGQLPTRNAKTNSLITQLVQRLGAGEAPKVAAYYCGHPSSYYSNRVWPLDALVKDAEALRTQWATQTAVTPQAAQQASQQAHYEARRRRLADEAI